MKKLSFFLMAMLMSIMSFATEVTISFANANQRLSQDGNSQVWANAGVTFTNAKSASTNAVVDNTNPIRCYANSKITVEAPGNITKLVFDCNNGSYATALKNSIGNEASVSNDIVTVTPTSASETYVIVKLTAQVRIDKLTVTYTESGVAETVVANPIFSLAGGEYEGAQNVKISCSTVDATIYYTTNGEVPSKSSNVYSDPITISESTTIKAYAVKNGLEDSEIVEAVYTITEGPDAIIDFTSNDAWKFPADYDKTEKTYSDGTYTVVVNAASNGHKYQDGKLLLGKQGAYLVLPAFSKPVEKIACPAVTGASGKVTWNVYNGDNAVSQEVTACNIDQSFKIDNPAANQVYTIKVTNGNNLQISHIKIYYGEAAAVAKPYINGDAEFIESTEVTISAEEGLKVYYTLDGTDPTNASTEYTAPFKLTATTTVKAVAYDGETASEVSSKTFKAITLLTCKDAAELALSVANNNDLVPNGPYAFRGFVTNIAYAYQPGGTMSVWMADTKNGGKVMQAYKFTPEDGNNPPVVGDYLQVVGELTKYNTTPESAAGAIVTKYPAPVVNHNITVSANPAEAGTVTGDGEYEEGATATLTATAAEGYEFVNWTKGEEIVSTENPYKFTVTADLALVANFKEVVKAIEVKVTDATATSGEWSIDLAGSWNDQALTIKLWQDNTQGFGSYAPNTETGYYILLGAKELTPTTEGVYADNGDGTFTFTCSATDGTTQYNITVTGNNPTQGGGDEVYQIIDDAITNLTFNLDEEPYSCMGGPSKTYGIELYLVLGEDDGMGTFTLTSESVIGVMGAPATFISGYLTDIDPSAPAANAVIVAKLPDGSTFEFHIAMSSTPVDATVIVVENATLAIDSAFLFNNPISGDVYEYSLTMSGNWTDSTNTTYLVTVEFPVYDPATTEEQERLANIKVGDFAADDAPYLGMVEDYLTITNVNGVITAQGIVSQNGLAFDLTISGTLSQGPSTGVENLNGTVAPVKVIENGQIFIIRNGVKYNAQGAQL